MRDDGSAFGLIFLVAMMATVTALLGFAITDNANERLFFGAVLIGLVNGVMFRMIVKMGVVHSCCIGYLFVGGIFGAEVLALLGGLGLLESLRGSSTFPIMEKPWMMLLCLNLTCFAALALAWMMGVFLKRRPCPSFLAMLDHDRRCVENVLLVALLPALGSALEPFLPESIGYPVKIVAAGLNFLPFFAGYMSVRSHAVRWAWIAGLAVNAAVLLLIGGRFLALFPIVTFLIGYATGVRSARRWWLIGISLAATVPGFFLVGALGVIRDELGRDQRSNVSQAYFGRMMEIVGQISATDQQQLRYDVFGGGLARLVPWSNFAPVSMSPEIVPYRGFSTFPAEMWNACSIYAFAPKSRDEMVDLKMGTLAATDYGYNINENYSTEWGVMPDGWSRAGWWSGVAFVLFALGLILGLELIVLRLKAFRPAVKMFAIALLMERCVRIGSVPLLELLRTTALYFILFTPGLWVINRVLHGFFPEPAPLPTPKPLSR